MVLASLDINISMVLLLPSTKSLLEKSLSCLQRTISCTSPNSQVRSLWRKLNLLNSTYKIKELNVNSNSMWSIQRYYQITWRTRQSRMVQISVSPLVLSTKRTQIILMNSWATWIFHQLHLQNSVKDKSLTPLSLGTHLRSSMLQMVDTW